MSANPYLPAPATVVEVIAETPTIKTFVVRPAAPVPFQAGQFVAVTVPGVGEAPFTPSSSPAVADRLELTIMRAGRVTERLHALGPGAQIGIRGPLGQPYPIEAFYGKEVVIVGGGVGLAPLRALLFTLFENLEKYARVFVRYGARTPADLVYRQAVAEAWGRGKAVDVLLTVDRRDDGWTGHEGVVTTILERDKLGADPKKSVAVVCGPPIMMKFTTVKLLDLGYAPQNIYLSMEKNMSCGIGKCGHCRLGPYYACKDGPVFSYEKLRTLARIWD